VFKLTERECFARDLKLHSQTEDAVNSVCRNIAEGFACKHKEFARFLEISRRSLNELGDSFRTAQLKRYVTAHDYEPIWRLTHRLYPAFARLIHYLQTTADPDFSNRTRVRARRTDLERTRTDPKPTRPDLEPTRTDPKPPRTDPKSPRTKG
jgi:four helix bundle protein